MKVKRIRLEAARWASRMALGAAPVAAAGCMVGPELQAPASRDAGGISRGATDHPTARPPPATDPAAGRPLRRSARRRPRSGGGGSSAIRSSRTWSRSR